MQKTSLWGCLAGVTLLTGLTGLAIVTTPAKAATVRDFSQVKRNWDENNVITKLQLYKTSHGHYVTGNQSQHYFNMKITNRTNEAFRFHFTKVVADTSGGEFDGFVYKLTQRHAAVVVQPHHTVTVKKAFATSQTNLAKWLMPKSENYLSYGKKTSRYIFLITPKNFYRLYQAGYHTFD